MRHAQNFDGINGHTIGGDVGRAIDDQFTRSCPATGSADFRELEQPLDSREHPLHLPIGRWRIVVGDVVPRRSEIAYRWLSPKWAAPKPRMRRSDKARCFVIRERLGRN